MNNYMKYRGKCKEMSEQAVEDDPTLTLVRGHYHCPIWGEQGHWWTVREDGTIFDPTAKQFPSGGIEEYYVEFNGILPCANCGKEIKEEDAMGYGNYGFCSDVCVGDFVGVPVGTRCRT